MSKRRRATDEFDSPWKDTLQTYFPFFLDFFFPDIHQDIDWQRGYEALDKEFQQILRRAKVGKRFADKLFKVWLKDGAECWVLVHVEIQGDYEKEFPQRMFEYHVAVRQLYNQDVVSLALLCDDQPNWRPNTFARERWGCRIELAFRVAKLLDYLPDSAALESNDNPIASVVLAHLEAMQTRDDPGRRKHSKLRLAKGLYGRNWSREQIGQLLRLIDWVMKLPDDLEDSFQSDLQEFEKEKTVEYVTSFERAGIKKGLREGLLEGIEMIMDLKFGSKGRKLLPAVQAISNIDDLRAFGRFLKKAETLDEVREYLK